MERRTPIRFSTPERHDAREDYIPTRGIRRSDVAHYRSVRASDEQKARNFEATFPGLRYADTVPWDSAPENPTVPEFTPQELAAMTPVEREVMMLGAIPDDGSGRSFHRELNRLFSVTWSGEWTEIPVPSSRRRRSAVVKASRAERSQEDSV